MSGVVGKRGIVLPYPNPSPCLASYYIFFFVNIYIIPLVVSEYVHILYSYSTRILLDKTHQIRINMSLSEEGKVF